MKTEKEKMLAGGPYDFTDSGLQDRWHLAKQLQSEYNNTPTTDFNKKTELLNKLIGSKGENVSIAPPILVDYGENIHLGNNVEINMNCVFLDCNRITIGDSSGIGPGVHFYAVAHPLNPQERLSKNATSWKSMTAPVTIGKNVWIGGGSIILPGVTIGDGTTVGAGSVVTKPLPANVLAVGNPARIIRYL